jgi:hypothetical protein
MFSKYVDSEMGLSAFGAVVVVEVVVVQIDL